MTSIMQRLRTCRLHICDVNFPFLHVFAVIKPKVQVEIKVKSLKDLVTEVKEIMMGRQTVKQVGFCRQENRQ